MGRDRHTIVTRVTIVVKALLKYFSTQRIFIMFIPDVVTKKTFDYNWKINFKEIMNKKVCKKIR